MVYTLFCFTYICTYFYKLIDLDLNETWNNGFKIHKSKKLKNIRYLKFVIISGYNLQYWNLVYNLVDNIIMDYNNRFRILWYVPGPWILIWPLVCSLCYLQSKLYSYSVDVGKVTPDRDLNAQGHLEVYARRKDCWVILWINISLSDNNIIKKYDYFILVSYRLCCTTKCIFLKRPPFSKSLNSIFSHYFT